MTSVKLICLFNFLTDAINRHPSKERLQLLKINRCVTGLSCINDDGISHKIEGGLALHISYEMTETNQCRLRAHIE